MQDEPRSAQPPGESIRVELAQRGWTQSDLARILARPLPTINEIIQGKRAIMPEMAKALSKVFDISAEEWMRREAAYRLSLSATGNVGEVAERAKLFALAPCAEMERRGWIRTTDCIEELRGELCQFFDVTDLNDATSLAVATRRTEATAAITPSQNAWCYRAKQMAKGIETEKFRPELLAHCEERLRELAAFPSEAKRVSSVMAGFGIRFVVVEQLSGSKIDGAAFWLDKNSPVIATSVRFDRIDAFYFTLFHELAHIIHGDVESIDTDLVGERALPGVGKSEIEERADSRAGNALIPTDKLESFIKRVGPLYSKARINQFANRMKIHPGIVLGQLHHRGEMRWGALRELLPPVRELVIKNALTDGWGVVPGLRRQ